ncbi:MAG: efflux RND transporter periplasmic adaptor subunit [Candidatus Hydrogenedentes bacterium]|nr:efflux RND transporter periplasmic adaptor subunit [Candidatus Hydrogenedentota bacterium]
MDALYRPVLLICLLLVLGTGCGMDQSADATAKNLESKTEAEKTAETDVLIPVQAEKPARQDVFAYFETTTNVAAENQVQVTSKGSGHCLEVFVEEGDLVKEGQVLAELDKEELEAQIRQARVTVAQNKATYEVAEKSTQEGIGAPVERDNARFAYEQAQKSLEVQEVHLKNQTLTAPISGVVTRRNIQQGMLVTSGAPAFTIVDSSTYMLPINLPERELARVKEGQVAQVQIESQPDRGFEATVRRISPNVDPANGTVKIILDFKKEERKYLMESAFARVKLVMERHENALVIPKDSLIEENARTYLMVVQKADAATSEAAEAAPAAETPAPDAANAVPVAAETPDAAATAAPVKYVADRVEVKVGLEDSNVAEILEGLDENSLVVTLGQQTLKDGSTVNVTNAEAEILSRANLSAEEALQQATAKEDDGQEGKGRRGRGEGRRMRQ